ncbi:MAG: choice-of-anchor D domain-containing protein [Bryobacterales bacterium]|nr:choice-of-anchor D domain-containing protein [Bryobacterales bacterium]
MIRLISLFALAASTIWAQSTAPFSFRFQQGQNVTVISDGATLLLPADAVGQAVSGTLQITYRGAVGTQVTINSSDLTGSLDFASTGLTESFNIIGGNTVTAGIRYNASTGTRQTARIQVSYTEGRTTNSFSFTLVGTAPDFAFSATPAGGNTQPITNGQTIAFPETAIDATALASLLITNRGSGPGPISAISITGASFQLVGAPLAGTIVEPGREVRVGIAFTPKQADAARGTVAVELPDRRVAFNLEGSGTTAQFFYELIQETGTSAFGPEGTVTLPDTNVNERSTVTIRVRNGGNADGRITAIGASGTGITVGDLPPLPVVLAPGNRFTFTVTFAPTQAGRVAGRLRIGNDQFDLAGSGLGSVLSYAYIAGSVNTTVQNAGSVNFVSTPVGANSALQFQISNTGTAPGSVTSISITTANPVFELAGLPNLPLTLAPGASTTFGVRFVPTALGPATATLRVDSQTFTLNGVGTNPAPLPSYSLAGASGTLEPLAQPAITLTLAEAYPLTLNGTLTLSFNSDVFANDPSVQFAAGGRTLNFTIPANTRQAVFPNNATSARLQAGTVAGTLTLSPTFATEGGINLTPTRPTTLNLAVAPAAPTLLSVAVASKTTTTVNLLVTGYSTSRAITQMDLTFTAASGENLTTQRITIPAEAPFLAWYQSTASQAFGSLFSATVPLTVSGEVNSTTLTSLVDAIQSVSVTIANRNGTSAARSVNLK